MPLIERSAAFAHGLIDVTFDEGEPSFIYGGNTFNNIPTTGPTGGFNEPTSGTGTTGPMAWAKKTTDRRRLGTLMTPVLAPNDTLTYGKAGTLARCKNALTVPMTSSPTQQVRASTHRRQSITRRRLPTKVVSPPGRSPPLATDANGNQLYPGPGFNLDVDRPVPCASGVATV